MAPWPRHLSSARDLAELARAALAHPDLEAAVGAARWVAYGSRQIELWNTNALVGWYPGVDGLKTGFTDEAGRTLAASATRGGRRVIVVLLDAPTRERDARLLLDWAFAAFSWPGGP